MKEEKKDELVEVIQKKERLVKEEERTGER